MKICIPTFLTTSKKAGVAFYTVNLIDALQETDSENQYYLLTYEGNEDMFTIRKPNFHKVVVPFKERSRLHLRLFIFYYHAVALRRFVRRNRIDVVHVPSTWFVGKSTRTVITIHDIVEFKTNRYSKAFGGIKQLMVRTALANARCILTVSQFSKNDIVSIGASPEKIFVTYNGVNQSEVAAVQHTSADDVLERYKLATEKYFIFIGTAQHHKNLPRLVQAFGLFHKEYPGFKLVLAGKKDNASKRIEKAIDESGLSGDVVQLDYISDATKEVLIREAAAYVFVSLHEGFGMPILEANRHKTPIIASNCSSLPEIAASTALYVDPFDVHDICDKMKMIVKQATVRHELLKGVDENLVRFNWHDTARKTKEIYHMSLQG